MSEWCACRTRNPVACVASVSRAKNARNIFAFAPFFAREKRRKPRFLRSLLNGNACYAGYAVLKTGEYNFYITV